MRTMITCLALAIAAALASPAAAIAADGAVMLTITGKIGNPNRPAFDPFKDAFIKGQDREFVKAHAFTRAALKKLPQASATANAPNWPKPVAVSGPRLSDVLSTAGAAEDAAITLVALDGYGAEFDAKDRKAKDWILAIDVDGEPLSIGGRGPAWLIFDTSGKPATSDEEGKWVWSVYLIEVE